MSELQLELETVIDHSRGLTYPNMMNTKSGLSEEFVPGSRIYAIEATHKPAGIRLAKMLGQYDDQPSSQLWSEIQGLAREILK